MTPIRIGLDIAKNVFQVHGVDDKGTVVIRKRLRRPDILRFFASLPSCLIGIEACSASHHWARVSTDIRNWTLFDIENWTPGLSDIAPRLGRSGLSR